MKAELCRLQELLPTSTLPGFVLVPLQSCLLPVPPTNITVSAGYVAWIHLSWRNLDWLCFAKPWCNFPSKLHQVFESLKPPSQVTNFSGLTASWSHVEGVVWFANSPGTFNGDHKSGAEVKSSLLDPLCSSGSTTYRYESTFVSGMGRLPIPGSKWTLSKYFIWDPESIKFWTLMQDLYNVRHPLSGAVLFSFVHWG